MVNGPKKQRHSAAISIGTDKAQHQLILLVSAHRVREKIVQPIFLQYILPFPGAQLFKDF